MMAFIELGAWVFSFNKIFKVYQNEDGIVLNLNDP